MELNGVFDDEILYDALIENNVEIAKQQLLICPYVHDLLDEDNDCLKTMDMIVTIFDNSELLEIALNIGLTLDIHRIRDILENCHSKQLRFLLDKKILSATMRIFSCRSPLYVVYCVKNKPDSPKQRECAIMLIDAGASFEDFTIDWANYGGSVPPPLYLEQFDKSRRYARAAATIVLGLKKLKCAQADKNIFRLISRLIWASRAMEAWIPTETLWQKIKHKISFF